MTATKSRTEPRGVPEPEGLSVTRRAGNPIIGRQAHVVEEHPPQGRPGIGDRVARWQVVDEADCPGSGAEKVRWYRCVGSGIAAKLGRKGGGAGGRYAGVAGDEQQRQRAWYPR